jgi:hypothetical protein
VVITERWLDASVLRTALKKAPVESLREDGFGVIDEKTFAEPWEEKGEPIGGTRQERTRKQKTEAFIKRLALSLAGVFFLIGPMWLMVLHNTKYTALVSTTVFVVTWGIGAALTLSDPISVLSTTAGYAAVLVVFVGTNTAG